MGDCYRIVALRLARRSYLASRFRIARLGAGSSRREAKASTPESERRRVLFFALRLVPAFPFFLINLAMGLTSLPTRTYYWVSQIGMLPGTLLYVYAGTQLGRFEVTWQLVLALVLLGIFPLAAKKILEALKARKVYARWAKPAKFDRNLVVIGGGSAGLVAAYIGAAVRAQVTLVEKALMAGCRTRMLTLESVIRSSNLVSISAAHDFVSRRPVPTSISLT